MSAAEINNENGAPSPAKNTALPMTSHTKPPGRDRNMTVETSMTHSDEIANANGRTDRPVFEPTGAEQARRQTDAEAQAAILAAMQRRIDGRATLARLSELPPDQLGRTADREVNRTVPDPDTATPMTAIDPPAWATVQKMYDGYVQHSTGASLNPMDAMGEGEVFVRMEVSDRLKLDDGRPIIAREDMPLIQIGTECAYRFSPAEARVLAAALIELADAVVAKSVRS